MDAGGVVDGMRDTGGLVFLTVPMELWGGPVAMVVLVNGGVEGVDRVPALTAPVVA